MTLVRLNNQNDSLLNHYRNQGLSMNSSFAPQPGANILESDKSFIIELAIPGCEKDDISIQLENGLLTISHEPKEKKESSDFRFARREFSKSSFSRSFRMSRWIDLEKIEASFKNGILEIEIPKKAEAITKPAREIKIS